MNDMRLFSIEMQFNVLIGLLLAKEKYNLKMISEEDYRKFIEDTGNNFGDVLKTYENIGGNKNDRY